MTGTSKFEQGQRVQLPGAESFLTIDSVIETGDGAYRFYLVDEFGGIQRHDVTERELSEVVALSVDGSAAPSRLLAGLWSHWMAHATESSDGTALGSAPLRPYLHQHEAVYGAMLPQPMLRFLLADEPGTGKTIMAGMYMTETHRLGTVNRALVICPAHLVAKWQDDISRFFGIELRRITAETIRQHALEESQHPWWIVSLQLAAMNPSVRASLNPDRAGWDLVVTDEGHRMTPSAETFFRVGTEVVARSPRALVMTATPHRGSERLFRMLMHLVDPKIFRPPPPNGESQMSRLRPSGVHFLRRMKESLVDVDGRTPLFKKRTAHNVRAPINSIEGAVTEKALEIVDMYFPAVAVGLGRMIYGKRAASSLYALRETLFRRGAKTGAPFIDNFAVDDEDLDAQELRELMDVASKAAAEERRAIEELVSLLDFYLTDEDTELPVSKWPRLQEEVLKPNNIRPGTGEQLVVFTEYADTADWLTRRFRGEGFDARMYSGRQSQEEREFVRVKFAAGEFQIIVSTDAGNEGIDLQTARVLVNWDIPYSLVTLEQRLGRIHRVGQDRDVALYNLIAAGTREGDAYQRLLDNLVAAANELDGKMFDSLALVGEAVLADAGIADLEETLKRIAAGDDSTSAAADAIRAITKERIRQAYDRLHTQDLELASTVDAEQALAGINRQRLERINPHIVERFLARLSKAELIRQRRSTVGDEGMWDISPDGLRPLPFGGTGSVLVATSGAAKTKAIEAGMVAAERATALGPNEEAFRQLVDATCRHLEPDLYRGGTLEDPTSLMDYLLFSFEVTVHYGRRAGGWQRATTWRYLVKKDAIGARVVPWELLANLATPAALRARHRHPADLATALSAAEGAVASDAGERSATVRRWIDNVEAQLKRLPAELTDEIDDSGDRVAERRRISKAIDSRVSELHDSVAFKPDEVRLAGWAHVVGAAGASVDAADSETVSMAHVTRLLEDDGWTVADVHAENLGYDLRAVKGSRIRAIEVKGINGSAASTGIRLTGAELAIAGQLRSDYWLYVVDGCADGVGTLFDAWSDPGTVFAGAASDVAILRIKGSDLLAARGDTS